MSDQEIDELESWLAQQISAEAGPCPDEMTLLSFVHGNLREDAMASIARHAGLCGKCQGVMLEERHIACLMSEVAGLPENEIPEVSEAVKRRIFATVPPAREKAKIDRWWHKQFSIPSWAALGAAASILLLLYPAWLGLVENRRLRINTGEINQPISDIQILTLFGAVRSEGRVPEASASNPLILLQLATMTDLQSLQHFQATLRDGSGRILWTVDELRPSKSFGGFSLAIPGSSIHPGPMTVIVTGYKDGQEKLHQEYQFAIIP